MAGTAIAVPPTGRGWTGNGKSDEQMDRNRDRAPERSPPRTELHLVGRRPAARKVDDDWRSGPGDGQPLVPPGASAGLWPGIRSRIVFLVVLSAVLPSLLVGGASYLTARDLLIEKINSQLASGAASAADHVRRSFEDRSSDTEVFASAFIVAENLQRRSWALKSDDEAQVAQATDRIGQYLAQIQERYPLYRKIFIFGPAGELVTGIDSMSDAVEPEIPARLVAAEPTSLLDSSRAEPLLFVRRQVTSPGGERLGAIVTASGLEELWRDLRAETRTESWRLRVVAADGRPLFDASMSSPSAIGRLASDATARGLPRQTGVAEYRDERGRPVLGAYRSLDSFQIGTLVEMDSETAFEAGGRLRDLTLLISLLAAGLVTAIGLGLAVSLTRPIQALIVGARAVSEGDLSHEVPVSSRDQIGYLTRVFNHMIRTLRDSRSRLEKISRTDELTGLFNRRHLADVFRGELSKAGKTGKPLSVLMIDFDRFKAFNDRFGHLEGDLLLREAGTFLVDRTHPTDILARYGGEEFVALLPATSKRQAAQLAERLRREFAEAHGAGDESSRRLTISIGVATAPEDGGTEEALIGAADAALYRAKREGRNQVQVAV